MRLENGEVLFLWPLVQHVITAGWLYSDRSAHHALDLRAAVGTPVYAAEGGTVDWVQAWDGRTKTGNQSYGNLVRIRHQPYQGGKLQTYYAHLSSFVVKNGQTVEEGQLIGYAGNTGNSFGSHLHFEVRLGGSRCNPLNWLDGEFTTANSQVILGSYTSVERTEKEKEEPTMTYTSDTLKIGPVSTGDRNSMKTLAAQLGAAAQDEGDYLLIGPMGEEARDKVAEKAAALALGCVDYTAPVQTDLTPVMEALDKVLAGQQAMADTMGQLMARLTAAGKALA